jgi:hypothetical protein
MRRMRGFIDIDGYPHSKRREGKVASMCYPGMCGSMISTIKWAHQYAKKDSDFALEVLRIAITEREKVEHVIKRFNRRFN